MEEIDVRAKPSWRLAIVFYVYLALIFLGWGCILFNEDALMEAVVRTALWMLGASAGLAVVVGIPWALYRHRMKKRGEPLSARKTTGLCFAMVVLLPFLFIAGIGIVFIVPYWIADLVKSEETKTVKTATSPDGKWLAYVVGKPALDGPNWQLYLKRAGEPKGRRVARLMGDVDSNHEIHWSPRGDVVLFKNYYSLFAIRPADLKSAAATIGARRAVNPNGSFCVDCRALAEVGKVDFPAEGGVEYTTTLKDKSETKRLEGAAFQSRPEGYAVSPFEGEAGG